MLDVHDHKHFLLKALEQAARSKDPDTQVGAVIVRGGLIQTTGFNRFPPGIEYTRERLMNKELKNRLMVHGERAAIQAAAREGISIAGATLYFVATDDTLNVWGGAPCTPCTLALIDAGISRIVTFPPKPPPSRWHDDCAFARDRLIEAKLELIEVQL